MGRVSRGKSRKSEVNSEGEVNEEEVTGSVKVDNDETGSGNEVEATNSTGKKRNARGRVKTNEENQEDDKEDEAEAKENGKPQSKRRKKDSDENDSKEENNVDDVKDESDQESEKTTSKKKKENESQKKNKVEENGKSPAKSKKKGGKAAQKEEENDDDDDGEEYEVEKIIDQRTIKGRRQFLVRWKGYTAESDTWEQEKELNCDRLIEEFLAEQEENNESEKEEEKEKPTQKTKAKKQEKKSKQKKTSKAKNDVPKKDKDDDKEDNDEDDDDEKEYEVERIIEVHFKKDKKRDFLIRWKGFSAKDDSWEPEENLNCPELINKFMEKVEKAKSIETRELRVNPSHTKRYTLTMHGDKRQSRRNADRERVTYHEYEA